MKDIASFQVDHTILTPGLYFSRADGPVHTFDLRLKKPNTGDLLTNTQLHSVEHLIATLLRNSAQRDSVVYFGPMGCQTGFYFLFDSRTLPDAAAITLRSGKPVINRSACIRCFCCQEFCPQGAMRIARPLPARILNP